VFCCAFVYLSVSIIETSYKDTDAELQENFTRDVSSAAVSAILWALLPCWQCNLYNYCRCSCAEQIKIHSFIHRWALNYVADKKLCRRYLTPRCEQPDVTKLTDIWLCLAEWGSLYVWLHWRDNFLAPQFGRHAAAGLSPPGGHLQASLWPRQGRRTAVRRYGAATRPGRCRRRWRKLSGEPPRARAIIRPWRIAFARRRRTKPVDDEMDKTSDDLWIPSDRGGLAMLPVGPEDTDNGGVWG